MSQPPSSARPDGSTGGWDSLSFGADEPPVRRRPKVLVGLLAAGVLALGGGGLAASVSGSHGPAPRIITLTAHPAPPSMFTAMDGSNKPFLTGRPLPAATTPPTGLGVDPTFDRFAAECFDGVMRSCDELYDVSAPQSKYETFADTCAGRQPKGTLLYCTTSFPGS
jgi:hypothetical protein